MSADYLPQLAGIGITHVAWTLGPNWADDERAIDFACLAKEPYVSAFTEAMDAYDWLARQPIKPRDPGQATPPPLLT